MKPALITGTAAAIAYLTITAGRAVQAVRAERLNRRAWNHYRSEK